MCGCVFFVGGGLGFCWTGSITILGSYFRKRHALATGIAYAGIGVGVMVFSPLCQYLIDVYGWRGALLIIAGIYANTFVAASLLRPVSTINPKYRVKYCNEKEDILTPSNDERRINSCCNCVYNVFVKALGFHLFTKYRVLVVFCICQTLLGGGNFASHSFMMACAIRRGVEPLEATTMMTFLGVSLIISRLIHGWFVDKRFIAPIYVYAMSVLCYGIFSFLFGRSKTYVLMVISSVGFGLCQGIFMPLIVVTTKDLVRSEDFASGFGLTALFFSIGEAVGLPLFGIVYDVADTCDTVYYISGCTMVISFMILVLVSLFIKFCHQSIDNSTESNSSGPHPTLDDESVTRT
ncbi:monocarboxylate transporter 12-like [Glandiceps talaboti]